MQLFVLGTSLALLSVPSDAVANLRTVSRSSALGRRKPSAVGELVKSMGETDEAKEARKKAEAEAKKAGHATMPQPSGQAAAKEDVRGEHAQPVVKAADPGAVAEWKMQEAHFGDTRCPCIGFDNIEGTISVTYGDENASKQVIYPADLGARCEKWESGRHPECLPGGSQPAWCDQAWCLVDSCNCRLPVLPKRYTLAPDTLYRGKPLYYSYASCGSQDFWSKQPVVNGNGQCRCIGFDQIPGTMEIQWKDPTTDKKQMVQYPAEMGGSCRSWDDNVHPMCKGAGKKPSWCDRRWCYVDPCSCDIGTPPKVTMYLPWATFTGKSLYYSYETCGSEDSFTTELNLEACVNQKSAEQCVNLKVRNGVQKCHWTGTNCLGSELVAHPLCAKIHNRRWSGNQWVHSASRHAASLGGALLPLLLLVSTISLSM